MKRIPLHFKIILGLVLGIIYALIGSKLGWSEFTINWIDPFGRIFINLLKLIAVPLVLFSIIGGISSFGDASRIGRLGVKTLLTYLVTTLLAVGLGLLLVNTINPGKFVDDDQRLKNRIAYELWVSDTEGVEILDGKCAICDADESLIGEVKADMAAKGQDEWTAEKLDLAKKKKESGPLDFLVDMVPSNIFISFNDSLMLQVIFFAIFFGLMLLMIPKEKAQPVIAFVDGANEVFMKMVDVIMRAAPVFVFALMAGVIAKMAGDDLNAVLEIFKGLSSYAVTVVIGLGLLVFAIYPNIVRMFNKRANYRRFFRAISPAQLLAFSTSSSVATLPVTMECVEDNIGVSKETASFVLPIGATVNMDGTSLYQGVAVVFLAQFHEVDLSIMQQLTIVFTATLASIGSAAVPSAGLVMMIIVLQSVGLDPAWIALIFPIDRPLDMCRTVVNVTGDATVSSIVATTEGEEIFVEEIS